MPSNNVKIFEPLYAPGQQLADPAFEPLPLDTNVGAEWRELAIYVHMYRLGLHREQRLTGLFSPKFRTKAMIKGQDFLDHVESHTDADVVFVNPAPYHPYIMFNSWTGGELTHPGLIDRSQELLAAVGVPWQLSEEPYHGPDVACYSNFWVATEAFWDDYVGGLLVPIANFLEAHPNDPVVTSVMELAPHTLPTPYIAFTVERLFTSKLLRSPEYRRAPMLLPPEPYCFTPFEVDLVRYSKPKVERAVRQGAFDDETMEMLTFVSRMRLRYSRLYFQQTPHPHTGKLVPVFDLPGLDEQGIKVEQQPFAGPRDLSLLSSADLSMKRRTKL